MKAGRAPESEEVDEEPLCIFSKSFACVRRAMPQLLPTHPRRVFRDWSKAIVACSEPLSNDRVAHKHFHTGRDFLKPIM